MGYDMHFVRRGDDDYIRLNVWGMGTYAQLMHELGMVYPSTSRGGWPEWDRYPDDEKKQEQFEAAHEHLEYGVELDAPAPDDVLAAAREYVEAGRVIRVTHPDGGQVIPSHKFGTNDGWIVTPNEIVAALAEYLHRDGGRIVLDRLGTEDRKAYWDQWIDYLRRAVENDGFEVW
jgi:hypothetical protein